MSGDITPKNKKKMQYPWMKTEDLQLASFGRSGEGWFDP